MQRRQSQHQMELFADVEQGPRGLGYEPGFVSACEHSQLVAEIRDLPLAPFQFGAYQGSRRVFSFGSHYDFQQRRLKQAPEMPPWLAPFARRVEDRAGLPLGAIQHALITEYRAGAGIGWHRDKMHFDEVFGLSLGSPCNLRFRRKTGAKWERYLLEAQPRSLYVLSDEARLVWEHSIAAVDCLRYSVTFRSLAISGEGF